MGQLKVAQELEKKAAEDEAKPPPAKGEGEEMKEVVLKRHIMLKSSFNVVPNMYVGS